MPTVMVGGAPYKFKGSALSTISSLHMCSKCAQTEWESDDPTVWVIEIRNFSY